MKITLNIQNPKYVNSKATDKIILQKIIHFYYLQL